jgi:hypothetical protein
MEWHLFQKCLPFCIFFFDDNRTKKNSQSWQEPFIRFSNFVEKWNRIETQFVLFEFFYLGNNSIHNSKKKHIPTYLEFVLMW